MGELADLQQLIADCREKIEAIDNLSEFEISDADINKILESYRALHKKHEIHAVGGHSFYVRTGDQSRHISFQEIPCLSILADNLKALEQYRIVLDSVCEAMGFSSRVGDGKGFFKRLPTSEWDTSFTSEEWRRFSDAVTAVLGSGQDRDYLMKFVSDPDWGGLQSDDGTVGRKLDRSTDWQESAVLKTGNLVAAANAGRLNLIRAISGAGFGANLAAKATSVYAGPSGENVIFYGAPGTGKSKTVDDKVGKNPIRTVFHPDLQNSDFFGSLKPQMNGSDVEYHFVPGPFMEAVLNAHKHPDKIGYLVIEELNRAPAAAVFGDLFLLLDRDESGKGEYDVSFPSVESRKWFEDKTGNSVERLRIPSNLTIYATMNSADQGVFPIDTAFRRRWRQVYLPLDYNAGPEGEIGYVDSAGIRNKIQWRDFVRLLNSRLVSTTDLGIAEDRLLGQWFVKADELDGSFIPEKVLLYLWDDLLRHGGREQVYSRQIKTYGDLNSLIGNNKRVLSEDFLTELSEISKPAGELEPEKSVDEAG